MMRPLHKPGTIPLRPLTLSDIFDGAFATIRRNPRSTLGMGAVVTAVFMLIPIIGSVLLASFGLLSGALTPGAGGAFADSGATVALYGGTGLSTLFALLANVVVAGMVVPVVTRGALGELVPAGTAWRQVKGRVRVLVFLALFELLVQVFVIGVPTLLAGLLGYAVSGIGLAIALGLLFFFLSALAALGVHVRWFQLAAPIAVVERRGVFASLARAARLQRGGFWRILGILVLSSIVAFLVGQLIGVPLGLVGGVLGALLPGSGGPLAVLLTSNLSTIISGAVVAPFTGCVAVLQYLDMRFRNEGFDLDLITHVEQRSR